MNNKILKITIYVVIALFLLLYFFGSSIFQSKLTQKRDLTTSQIAKFEEDVKNGVEIDINEYVVKDKTYDNIVTNTNKRISNIIELGFKKIFDFLLKNIDV